MFCRDKRKPHSGIEADIAQLVEQLIRNQQVSGSTPLVGSITFCTYVISCKCVLLQKIILTSKFPLLPGIKYPFV